MIFLKILNKSTIKMINFIHKIDFSSQTKTPLINDTESLKNTYMFEIIFSGIH